MAIEWFKRDQSAFPASQRKTMDDALWVKCSHCSEIVFKRELEKQLLVCPKCSNHFVMEGEKYIEMLVDEGSWVETAATLKSKDPLGFRDSKKYGDRLNTAVKNTGKNEAITTGTCTIDGYPMMLGIMEFSFMGGSVGSVVGEKIARAVDTAIAGRRALVLISRSGGMRMQEGMVSLMQMAKASVKLTQLSDAGLPYISLLTHPTTGGTTASFSMQGDVIIAEPGALIGFAGPRVIKQTIGQDLPDGFQRSEFLMDKGFLDCVVQRKDIRKTILKILDFTMKETQTA